MTDTVLVRAKMKPAEWRKIKAKAAMLGVPVGELAAEALRTIIQKEGGKK